MVPGVHVALDASRPREPELVSIVVPTRSWDDWLFECLRGCVAQDHPAWDVWVVADGPMPASWRARIDALGLADRFHVLVTGPANPARKRNAALRATQARFIALVDADACPAPDWIRQALSRMDDSHALVGGPNLTPPRDPVLRRACGNVMQSVVGFGAGYLRHVVRPAREVCELPACNLVFRREAGILFREELATAEDMLFCADFRRAGYRILYAPQVVVHHHRRRLLFPFARQFWSYGFDKGLLGARSGALHAWQFAPSAFVLYLALLPFSLRLRSAAASRLAWSPLALYLAAISVESARQSSRPAEILPTVAAFLVGHLAYGSGFLRGLLGSRWRARSGAVPVPAPQARLARPAASRI